MATGTKTDRLALWALGRIGGAFKWGETDCWMLSFEAVDILTGSRLARAFRGRWGNALSAARFNRTTTLSRELIKAGFRFCDEEPRAGDIIIHPAGPYDAGHVCIGAAAVSSNPRNGIALVDARRAASVPGAKVMRRG